MGALIERLYGVSRISRKMDLRGEVLPSTNQALSSLVKVAWPSVLESVLISFISIVDTAMVSSLGTEAIAAVGLSSQPRFLFLAIFMSLNTGITAVIARRKGQDDRESANRTLRQVLLLSSILSLVLSGIGIYYAKGLLLFIGAEPDTIGQATIYTQIVIGGIFFNALSMNINAAQRGIGNTRLSMKTNLIANGVNVVFNYLLIGGHFGFPALGVMGAAIATSFGFVVASVIALHSILKKDGFLHISFKERFLPDKQTLAPVVRVAGSAAIEQVFMRLGFFIFTVIIGRLGTVAYATHQVSSNFMNVAFAFGEGLAIATASLLGQSLGRKELAVAQMYGHLSQRIGLTIGLVLAAVFVIMRKVLFLPFTSDPNIVFLGSQLLIILAFIVPAQISQVIFSTCLRVSGDTRYVAGISLVSIALVRTISSYVLCYPLGLGLPGAWLGMMVDQYVRLALHAARFASGKWRYISL